MTDVAVALSRKQADEVFAALRGIDELLKGLERNPGIGPSSTPSCRTWR
jgi:hypothetical protein